MTAVTIERKPLLTDLYAARCVVRELVLSEAQTLAYVIMPNHLHWLLQLKELRMHRVVQRMKSRSAITANRMLGRHGALWQHGYHDRALRADEDVRHAARYIVANPLRANLVEHALDYSLWDAVWM